jgi:hypothetical protein
MPGTVSAIAILAAYNEADVIGPVVDALIAEGVQVYLLDDGSTDETSAIVGSRLHHGVIGLERLPASADGDVPRFDWGRILRRKAELAHELDADWFIHQDADEFRESPWTGVTLAEALARVDALGFNAVDFHTLDFRPVDDRFTPGTDVRDAVTGYTEAAPYDRMQIRCWKKTVAPVDLVSSGGHEARFPGRKVFPIPFLLRHYPIRGQAHGERKVFGERRRRYDPQERARGWHVQYDEVAEGASFLHDASTLTPYDPTTVRMTLALANRDVTALECSVASLRREQESLEGELARLHDAVARAQTMQADLETRLREMEHENQGLQDALAHAAANRDRLEQDAASWRAAAEGSARRVADLERSKSWRWTAPARAAFARLERLLPSPRFKP